MIVIFREGKVEGFDALFHAPALCVLVFVHISNLSEKLI
jgi:hypothetical protein